MAHKGVELMSLDSWPCRPSFGEAIVKDETVRFLQLVCIFTDLVPKILLDVLSHHITLNKSFQMKFDKKPWDGGQEHRKWLSTIMEKNPLVQDFFCAVVKEKPATEWDITNLCAALSAVMEPSPASCSATVTQACSGKGSVPIPYFDVSVSERADCKTWEGFSINVTGASPSEVVECVVTEALGDNRVVAVNREMVNNRDLTQKFVHYLSAEVRPVYLPQSELPDIIKVRQSRNAFYHRSKMEVSFDEFTQCVVTVQHLIERALCPYCPKEDSDGYLTNLEEVACSSQDFKKRFSDDRAVLGLFQKALDELKHVMEELGETDELCQKLGQDRVELLKEMKQLETELWGVVERLSCLEGIGNEPQIGLNVLCQRVDQLETQARDCTPRQPPAIIAGNTLTEGSTINVSVVVAAGQGSEVDPGLSQLTVTGAERPIQVALKEQAYDEYGRFKLGEGPKANVGYTKLAVLKRPPSSKPEDVQDKMKAIQRFKECGPRLAEDNVSHVTPVDLLKKGSERIRVVYGQAGSGKTTLLKQMCRAVSIEEGDSDYELVLFFPLRDPDVSGAGDLQSLLSYYLQDEDPAEVSSLVKVLKESKGKGILLVFDGADEMKDLLKPSSKSLIQSLLQGRVFPEAHIIISSRPGACPSLQDHSATFYEVQGFNHAAIVSYVKSFFEADPPTADRMLSQLDTRPDLLGGMYIPMNCFILCSIVEHDSSFPATMTACYQAFVAHTISRECSKEGREVLVDPTLKDLPADVDGLMLSLGRLSYNGLCENPPCFVFDESSIHTTFPKLPPGVPIAESLFKGLLHVHASRKGYQSSLSLCFPHASQQEFFAALHVSRLPPKEQVRFWKENLSNISFSVVLRFYAGLTGLGVSKVAKHLCTSSIKESRDESLIGGFLKWVLRKQKDVCSNEKPHLFFIFHALFESQNLALTSEVLKQIRSTLSFSLTLSAFDTMAMSYCLSQCSHLKQLNLDPRACTLLSTQCLSHFKAVLQANPQCQLQGELCLSSDHFTADDAQTLYQVAVSLSKLVLWVSHTDCKALSIVCSLPGVRGLNIGVRKHVKDDSGWQQVETSLANNKHLNELGLDGCYAFVVNMLRALTMGKNKSVENLYLFRDEPLPDKVVVSMTQLCTLYIRYLPLPVLKALAERKEPLETFIVGPPPGVNWDGLCEDQWKEAEEVTASAKAKKVDLQFDVNSRQRSRAVQSITNGLSRNEFIRNITLRYVPEEMKEAVQLTLTNHGVTCMCV